MKKWQKNSLSFLMFPAIFGIAGFIAGYWILRYFPTDGLTALLGQIPYTSEVFPTVEQWVYLLQFMFLIGFSFLFANVSSRWLDARLFPLEYGGVLFADGWNYIEPAPLDIFAAMPLPGTSSVSSVSLEDSLFVVFQTFYCNFIGAGKYTLELEVEPSETGPFFQCGQGRYELSFVIRSSNDVIAVFSLAMNKSDKEAKDLANALRNITVGNKFGDMEMASTADQVSDELLEAVKEASEREKGGVVTPFDRREMTVLSAKVETINNNFVTVFQFSDAERERIHTKFSILIKDVAYTMTIDAESSLNAESVSFLESFFRGIALADIGYLGQATSFRSDFLSLAKKLLHG